MMNKQKEFEESIKDNNISNIKLLLKDQNVDPSFDNNWAIFEIDKQIYFHKLNTSFNKTTNTIIIEKNKNIQKMQINLKPVIFQSVT